MAPYAPSQLSRQENNCLDEVGVSADTGLEAQMKRRKPAKYEHCSSIEGDGKTSLNEGEPPGSTT